MEVQLDVRDSKKIKLINNASLLLRDLTNIPWRCIKDKQHIYYDLSLQSLRSYEYSTKVHKRQATSN